MPNAAAVTGSDKSPSSAAGGGPALSPVKDLQVEDVSMRKAYEDTELLKAIVVPLEEQVFTADYFYCSNYFQIEGSRLSTSWGIKSLEFCRKF